MDESDKDKEVECEIANLGSQKIGLNTDNSKEYETEWNRDNDNNDKIHRYK